MKWLKNLCLYSFIIALAAVILGILRYKTCYLPGLQGLFVGLLLGAVIGKLGSGSEEMYSFRRRLRLSLVFSVFFVVIQTITVSLLKAEPGDTPFTWMWNVIGGYDEEYFFSMGRTRFTVNAASGRIDGVWWIMMSFLETGLFAFGAIAGFMLGLPSAKNAPIAYRD